MKRTTVTNTVYAICGTAETGRKFLFHGTASSRTQAITQFCHDMDTEDRDLPENCWSRALDPRTRKAWMEHYRRGRRCIKVTVTGKV